MTDDTWQEEAEEFVIRYVATRPGQTFSANDLWNAGLPHPSDKRRLNRVLLGLASRGVIEATDRKVPSLKGWGVPIRLWRALPVTVGVANR